jgi:hypothetical protein
VRLYRLAVAAVLVLACEHSPAGVWSPEPRGPFVGGNPRRVTFNPGMDLRPSWLPDGSGFWYSQERPDRTDRDHCLAVLPAAGGAVTTELCERDPAAADSITTFESAAQAADGRLAFVRASTPLSPATLAPRTLELWLATGDGTASIVKALPYTAPGGRIHQGVEWLQWLSAGELIYVGQAVSYPSACGGCPPDTVRAGREIARLDAGTGAVQVIAGTDSATSAAVVGNTLYYSVTDDNTVQAMTLPGTAAAPAHDFGTPPRDITAAAGRLVAVVGPGLLRLVDLSTGAETPLSAGQVLFKRPALSPDGRTLVVEGYPFQIVPITLDTIVSRVGDLWVFDLP